MLEPLFNLGDLGARHHVEPALVQVTRHALQLGPDPRRVVAIPLNYGASAVRERVERALRVPDEQVGTWLAGMAARFNVRHRDLQRVLEDRWRELADHLGIDDGSISIPRRLLTAAYLTMEYAIEAAALCNPSVVASPDQSDTADGEVAVVVSLRAIGEGHRSSVEFRSGRIDGDGVLALDVPSGYADTGSTAARRIGGGRRASLDVGPPLGRSESRAGEPGAYDVTFEASTRLDERVLFGAGADESCGIEDARFVRLTHPDGSTSTAATCTAYNGRAITVKLIRTDDFQTFRVDTLTGPGAADKGIALFPRQVAGRWWAVSRQDGQRMFVTTSADLLVWDEARVLDEPRLGWELLQQGNCGSPIETRHGWLLLTHGVGPMRRYAIGAVLLDLDDPSKVVARLVQHLMEPDEDEREGYVPNVLYSCGGIAHNGRVVLPYAASDRSCKVASFDIDDLVTAMTAA